MNAAKIRHWWLSGGSEPSDYYQAVVQLGRSVNKGMYWQSVDPISQKLFRIWTPIDNRFARYFEIAKENSTLDQSYTPSTGCGLMEYFDIRVPDSHTGTWPSYGSANASWCSVVGGTMTITFTGTGIKFRHFADNRGGVWRFNIDNGAQIVDISTFSSATVVRKMQTIVEGLAYGQHTMVGTFIGSDPLNPPSGGTPFGWASVDFTSTGATNPNIYDKTFFIIGSPTPNHCDNTNILNYVTDIKFSTDDSYKDLSFNVRERGQVYTSEWIPLHGGTSFTATQFANVATDRTMKADGGPDLIPTTSYTMAASVTELVLRQVYKGVNFNDDTNYLFDVTVESRYTIDENSITYSMNTLKNIDSSTCYIAMLDMLKAAFGTVMIRGGYEFDISATTSQTTIVPRASLSSWDGIVAGVKKTGTDLEKSYVIAMKVDNHMVALNAAVDYNQALYEETITSPQRCKVYARAIGSRQFDAGYTFNWTARWSLGLIPDAYNTLSQI